MRIVLWLVGASWAAIGAWYLYQSAGRSADATALGYSLIFGMLLYIFPGLVLMALGALLGRRHARHVAAQNAYQPGAGLGPASAAGTAAAAAAAAGRDAAAQPVPASARLDELQALRTKQLITQAEYERKRAEILRGV